MADDRKEKVCGNRAEHVEHRPVLTDGIRRERRSARVHAHQLSLFDESATDGGIDIGKHVAVWLLEMEVKAHGEPRSRPGHDTARAGSLHQR